MTRNDPEMTLTKLILGKITLIWASHVIPARLLKGTAQFQVKCYPKLVMRLSFPMLNLVAPMVEHMVGQEVLVNLEIQEVIQ